MKDSETKSHTQREGSILDMRVIVGNRISNPSSNPKCGSLHFTLLYYPYVLPLARGK